MKKSLLAIAVLATIAISAQTNASVTASIILHDVQSISVNNANITLEYLTAEDYINGVESKNINHVSTFSTLPYNVTSKILLDNVLQSGDIALNGIVQTVLPFNLFNSGSGRHLYDVTYKAKGSDAYLNELKTTYNYSVQYTIVTQ